GATGTVGPNLDQRLKSDCATPASKQARGASLQQCISTAITKPYAYLPHRLRGRDHARDLLEDLATGPNSGAGQFPGERDKVRLGWPPERRGEARLTLIREVKEIR
ncbi:MAG: hypothetical protein M3Z06_12840, partial [Actinomycetota bacterium]|nr:hypothetical protein [Actinomycetota bacterium]